MRGLGVRGLGVRGLGVGRLGVLQTAPCELQQHHPGRDAGDQVDPDAIGSGECQHQSGDAQDGQNGTEDVEDAKLPHARQNDEVHTPTTNATHATPASGWSSGPATTRKPTNKATTSPATTSQ